MERVMWFVFTKKNYESDNITGDGDHVYISRVCVGVCMCYSTCGLPKVNEFGPGLRHLLGERSSVPSLILAKLRDIQIPSSEESSRRVCVCLWVNCFLLPFTDFSAGIKNVTLMGLW